MDKEEVLIVFKSKQDFRNRIAKLWQDQEENEIYVFEFPDEETEREFEALEKAFLEGKR